MTLTTTVEDGGDDSDDRDRAEPCDEHPTYWSHFSFATLTKRKPGDEAGNHLSSPAQPHPLPLGVTEAMAKSDERLDTVMEEALDADFEKVMGAGKDRRERCVGESFPIFSDAEAEEDNDADEPQFVSVSYTHLTLPTILRV